MGFPGDSVVRTQPANEGDPGSIPGLGRSPGEGNGNPFQYSCLENPMDGGAWWATVHGVAKSWTRLSDLWIDIDRNNLSSLPGSSVSKESACNSGDWCSNPGLGRYPWRRGWQPTLVFLPGKFHGQRSLVGYSPRGCESRTRLND